MSGFDQSKDDLRRTVREITRVVVSRRWAFLIPFCVAATFVFISSHRLPRVYKASTVFERRNTIPIAKVLGASGPESMAALRQTLHEDMLGMEAMCRVVDRLGLTADLPRDEQGVLTPESQTRRRSIAGGLAGRVAVVIEQSSADLDRFQITATGGQPVKMTQLANAVRDEYTAFVREKYLDQLRNARDFYENEIEGRHLEIDTIDMEMARLMEAFPYASSSGMADVNTKLFASTTKRESLEVKIEDYRRKIRFLEARLEEMPPPRMIDHDMAHLDILDTESAMQSERYRLKSEILALANRAEQLRVERGMLDTHPEIQKLARQQSSAREDLGALEAKMGNDVAYNWIDDPAEAAIEKSARNNIVFELVTNREALASAEHELKQQEALYARFEEAKSASEARRPEMRRLMDQRKKIEAELSDQRQHVKKIASVLNIDAKDQGIEFVTVHQASAMSRPVLPKSKTIMMLAIGLGLACGACAVFLREFFDSTFRNTTTVTQSLGVQVLESIDEIVLPADRRRLLLKKLVGVPIAVMLIAATFVSGGLAYLSIEEPATYKRLVDNAEGTWSEVEFVG